MTSFLMSVVVLILVASMACAEELHSPDVASDWTPQDWCRRLNYVANSDTTFSEFENPFDLIPTDDFYTPGQIVTVILTSRSVIGGMVAQARSMSPSVSANEPTGSWKVTPEVTTNLECSDNTANTIFLRNSIVKRHLTLHWQPHNTNRDVIFVAVVLDRAGKAWNVTSDIIRREVTSSDRSRDIYPDLPVIRQRRDIEDLWQKEFVNVTTPYNATDFNVTTSGDNLTTTGTKTTGGIDAMSLFNLMTIIGAYIGMYMIFSFLLI